MFGLLLLVTTALICEILRRTGEAGSAGACWQESASKNSSSRHHHPSYSVLPALKLRLRSGKSGGPGRSVVPWGGAL